MTSVAAGIDVGSYTAKAVVVDERGEVLGEGLVPSGADFAAAGEAALAAALSAAGTDRPEAGRIVATGYGRSSVPSAGRRITEITCHARGASRLAPGARMVVDVGGQDCKVIRLDADGSVADFAMNDKCAAGTGRFLGVMAQTLGLPLEDLAFKARQSTRDLDISSTCAVFAESEVISLLARGESAADVARAVHRSLAKRLAGLVRQAGLAEPAAFTGGGALNADLVACLGRELGVALTVPPRPQMAGALGAALIAAGA